MKERKIPTSAQIWPNPWIGIFYGNNGEIFKIGSRNSPDTIQKFRIRKGFGRVSYTV